jgi:hypothetical protein
VHFLFKYHTEGNISGFFARRMFSDETMGESSAKVSSNETNVSETQHKPFTHILSTHRLVKITTRKPPEDLKLLAQKIIRPALQKPQKITEVQRRDLESPKCVIRIKLTRSKVRYRSRNRLQSICDY